MSRKPKPAPDPVRERLLQACHQVVAAGGVVLVGQNGQPFAFYPQHASFFARDPGAPERLREILRWRLLTEDERLLEGQLFFESTDPETLAGAGSR